MSQYTEAQQQILIKYLGTVALVFNECEMSYYNDYGFNSDGTPRFTLLNILVFSLDQSN